ncbi:SIMPL domain-containing protein [Sphingomonas sanguinis]|uniref:SIMPL domain-containing protein n=1 Tax=Sphingomonas sanguinis TaxID=33051 RepID=A0ABU5LLV3_9SPHN|nr:SIMPL domain-containing protein [Sphingomonas sanguinis]MDZ7280904.1 SIMPL domain-containing protein [Sphingomonas sanguinis]
MKAATIGMVMILSASGAIAQTVEPPQIQVSGTGTAKAPPDRATVGYRVRGEGATSDEATTRLRDNAKAIRTGAEGLLRGEMELHTADFDIKPVRSRECTQNDYGQVQLSTGPCAILGYVATMPVSIDTPRIKDAGTLVGLIGRLGGIDVGLQRFWLKDETPVRQQAMLAALASAKAQARLIAEGSGARLGALLRVQDGSFADRSITVTAARADQAPPPPPPPPAPEPIRVDLSSTPISINVNVMVAYAINQ